MNGADFHVTDNVHLNLTNNNINFIHAKLTLNGNLLISSRNLDIQRFIGLQRKKFVFSIQFCK